MSSVFGTVFSKPSSTCSVLFDWTGLINGQTPHRVTSLTSILLVRGDHCVWDW